MMGYSKKLREKKRKIVFVPTMGFLHKGHLTLMEAGRKYGDDLIVSIFVNPAQFGQNEDFNTYPRSLNRDIELCINMGASLLFLPQKEEMYPDEFQTYIELNQLPNHLCGLSRPLFFKGVATVVTKLFNIIRPDTAVFGEKDFQQLVVIRQLVKDLCMDINIVAIPTVRESDGLAMSSRNKYLTNQERSYALLLHQSLRKAESMVEDGEISPGIIIDQVKKILQYCPDIVIDYVSICDIKTLDDVDKIDTSVLLAIAVTLGKTRLIDNQILKKNKT